MWWVDGDVSRSFSTHTHTHTHIKHNSIQPFEQRRHKLLWTSPLKLSLQTASIMMNVYEYATSDKMNDIYYKYISCIWSCKILINSNCWFMLCNNHIWPPFSHFALCVSFSVSPSLSSLPPLIFPTALSLRPASECNCMHMISIPQVNYNHYTLNVSMFYGPTKSNSYWKSVGPCFCLNEFRTA